MLSDPQEISPSSFFITLRNHTAVRFAGVGVVSTACDIATLKVLFPHIIANITLATALAFLVGLTVGFVMNGQFVFKQERTVARYAKYGIISLGALILTEIIVHLLFVTWTLMGALSAKLVAVVLVFFWNYTWSKLWAFK